MFCKYNSENKGREKKMSDAHFLLTSKHMKKKTNPAKSKSHIPNELYLNFLTA